jgi:hypothetical protein
MKLRVACSRRQGVSMCLTFGNMLTRYRVKACHPPAKRVMNSQQRIGHWWHWWIAGYVVLVGVVVGTMFWLRQSEVADLSSPRAISDWQVWREDVREQQVNRGPVERRVPKSDEPPALVLMRDYFTVLMFGAILFSSLLYWIMVWLTTGILRTR